MVNTKIVPAIIANLGENMKILDFFDKWSLYFNLATEFV